MQLCWKSQNLTIDWHQCSKLSRDWRVAYLFNTIVLLFALWLRNLDVYEERGKAACRCTRVEWRNLDSHSLIMLAPKNSDDKMASKTSYANGNGTSIGGLDVACYKTTDRLGNCRNSVQEICMTTTTRKRNALTTTFESLWMRTAKTLERMRQYQP